MSLHRELTLIESIDLLKKSKKYLNNFLDNFSIEYSENYEPAKRIKKLNALENVYGPCVELMNYHALKKHGIHCINNNEMLWNDIGREEYDGSSWGDFSVEIDSQFYQLEVTTIYAPKDYRPIKKRLQRKIATATKYKDQGIIFLNLMNWFPGRNEVSQLESFIWNLNEKYEKVEAVTLIKHDMNYEIKKMEVIQKANSDRDLTKLKEMAMMCNI